MFMNVAEEHSGSLRNSSDGGSSRSRPHCLCWPFTLHGTITHKTKSLIINIIHFSCIVSLCYKNPCTHVRQYIALLFYIILRSEQKCVTGNVNKKCLVYCLMSVCICLVMVWKFCICSAVMCSGRRRGVVMVWQVATLPMPCYLVRKITTRSVLQSYVGYLRTSQPLVAL
jgi:hypothetical protein